MIDDHFDADEILRDVVEDSDDDGAAVGGDDVRELEFGTKNAQRAHFRELANDLEESEDLWN